MSIRFQRITHTLKQCSDKITDNHNLEETKKTLRVEI